MPNVSIFGPVYETEPEESAPLELYLNEVRTGNWEDLCYTIRNKKTDKEKEKLKEGIKRVTFSGRFSRRDDNSLIEHSGYIAIDLDDLDDAEGVKELLSKDRFVYAAFISTGGKGLTVLFRINGNKHKLSFMGISAYLMNNYGIIADPCSVSVSKPFGVTFDPNIYISENKVPIFDRLPVERKIDKIPSFAYAKDDFESLIRTVVSRGIDLTQSYEEWLKIGFAFADKFGDAGRNYYHAISSMSPKYNVLQTDKQFNYCLRSKNMKMATIATFYFYCKEAGLQVVSERTSKIKKATINGKAAGLKKEQIVANLEKFENITNSEDIVSEIFDGDAIIGEGGDTVLEQLELYITSNYALERNEITRYLEMSGKDISQRDMNSIYVAAKKQIREVSYELLERLLLSDFITQYNPIIRFFERLKPVNVKVDEEFVSPMIDLLAKTIVNDIDTYTQFFMRKWLVSIMSAAHGDHSPLVLVLVGEKQGTGKTEWFRRLFPPELKRYYAESKLDAGKDDEILMTQKLVIMDDEMSGKSKRETQRLKELTSKQWFSLREPYGRMNIDLMRLAVMCGTSNHKALLHDSTGNRRIIPVPVDAIDQKLYNSINKKELFAEVFSLWKAGFDWRIIDEEDAAYLKKYESEYEAVTVEGELISKYFQPSEDHDWLTSTEIKVELEKMTIQRLTLDQIGKELARLKFPRKSIRSENKLHAYKAWGVQKISRGGYAPYVPYTGENPF